MTNVFEKLRFSKAGVELKDADILNEEIKDEVANLDFRKMKTDDVIQMVDDRIRIERRKLKVLLVSSGIIALMLFSAIQGIQLEVSLLGIRLSNIQSAKEVILVAFISLNVFFVTKFHHLEELKALKESVFEKKYGKDFLNSMRRTFDGEYGNYTAVHGLISKKYHPNSTKKIVDYAYVFLWVISFSLLIAVIFWIAITIVVDVWTRPNISPFWAKVICILAGFHFLMDLVVTCMKSFGTFKYVDLGKWDEYSFYKKDSKTLSDETMEFIEKYPKKK